MEFVRKRISELMTESDFSASALSYELGHSRNYINNIVSGHSNMPVTELLYLIDLLRVTPKVFFDEQMDYSDSVVAAAIMDDMKKLSPSDLEAVAHMTGRLRQRE